MELAGCLVPIGLISIVLFAAYMLDRQRISSEQKSRPQGREALREFNSQIIFSSTIAVASAILVVGVFLGNESIGLLGAWGVSIACLLLMLMRYANKKSSLYKQLQKTEFPTETIKEKAEQYFLFFTPFEIGIYLGIFLCLAGFLVTFATGDIPFPFVRGSSPLIWIGFLLFLISGLAYTILGKFVVAKIPSPNNRSE